MLKPREDWLGVDDTFMSIALLVAMRSKDPNTQVGACLIDKDNRVIGTGYNGFPRDISSYDLSWDRCACKPENTKYLYIGHAEENAIDNCDRTRIHNSKLYVTLFPCNKCAIRIIQNKIQEVIYLSDKYHNTPECIASRKMFKLSKVKLRKFKSNVDTILTKLYDGTTYIFEK